MTPTIYGEWGEGCYNARHSQGAQSMGILMAASKSHRLSKNRQHSSQSECGFYNLSKKNTKLPRVARDYCIFLIIDSHKLHTAYTIYVCYYSCFENFPFILTNTFYLWALVKNKETRQRKVPVTCAADVLASHIDRHNLILKYPIGILLVGCSKCAYRDREMWQVITNKQTCALVYQDRWSAQSTRQRERKPKQHNVFTMWRRRHLTLADLKEELQGNRACLFLWVIVYSVNVMV